jgi:branched-chain amino acid transport system permease protein
LALTHPGRFQEYSRDITGIFRKCFGNVYGGGIIRYGKGANTRGRSREAVSGTGGLSVGEGWKAPIGTKTAALFPFSPRGGDRSTWSSQAQFPREAISTELGMTAEIIIQTAISGILMGFIYALIAAGLSLIFGLMEIVNFAHGEFMMISMYTAFWLFMLFGLDPIFSIPLCALLLFLVGVATHHGIIKRILHAPMLVQLTATFGLAIFLRSLAQFLWTPDFRAVTDPIASGRVEILGIYLGIPQIVASAGCILAFALLYGFINYTETGLALQATAQDREAASLMGIRTDRMYALGWGIGSACVGVAGALLSNYYFIFPEVGLLFALIAYVAVAMGGFGSIIGALVAGVLIGLIEALGGLLIDPAFKYAIIFMVYLGVVISRPQGIFGRY